VEYRLDEGAWKELSFANLTSEFLANPFNLDIKLTWTGEDTFRALGIYYGTASHIQKANLLPLDAGVNVDIKDTSLPDGARVQVYNTTQDEEVDNSIVS